MTANRTLPRRLPNAEYRQREYLTETEVERLIDAARKRGRNSVRDSAAILLAYRHGLRAQELCSLRWAQIDLKHGRLHVNRAGRDRERASAAWARAKSAATITRQKPLRVHDRSRHSGHYVVVLKDGSAYRQSRNASIRSPSPHAAPFNGVQAC
jgi:integrase